MSAADIIRALLLASDGARQVDEWATISVCSQPESMVYAVAAEAGVVPVVHYYPGENPTVIVVARLGAAWGPVSFAGTHRPATPDEIVAHQPAAAEVAK